jgi:heterodisulfide reductase subunit A
LSGRDASRGEGAGERVGLFLCRCAEQLGRVVGVDELSPSARWPQAAFVGVHDLLCAPDGLAWLRDRIREEGLDRVVIGGCSPREHEATFRKAAEEAGLSPWHTQLVNLREQVEWIGGDPAAATERAGRLLRAGIARVARQRDLPRRQVDASPDVAVIGGGAAGLSAALALAGRGRRVLLVEREFALGGLANELDELFPDGTCASCFMAPAIDDVLHHPAIDVLTGATVTAVRGSLGRFELTVASRPRFVDPETCLGCPVCVDACPVERPDAREGGLGTRRAISLSYAGCLPYVPSIDPAACIGLGGGTCRACADACAVGAIRLADRPSEQTLRAGAILLAVGMEPGPVDGPPGVVSTWRLERMLHPNGPTAGTVRGADGTEPRAVLLALSGDAAAADGELAIDALLKLAGALRARLRGARILLAGGLERSPRHAARVRELEAAGVELLAANWTEGGAEPCGGRVAARLRDGGAERTVEVDLVVLHAASRPAQGSEPLAAALRIARDARGFLDDSGPSPFEPNATRSAGVFVAGAAAGPRHVRTAIRDGKAAAGRILADLVPGARLEVEPLAAEADSARCCGCAACAASCAFGAVRRDPETGKAVVEPLHCRACGSCAAACPTGAMSAPNFTREQLSAEVSALLAAGGGAGSERP